jgi:hypothetical protein
MTLVTSSTWRSRMDGLAYLHSKVDLRALFEQLFPEHDFHFRKPPPTLGRRPFHDDAHDSISLFYALDGTPLWKCHTGCGTGNALTFISKAKGTKGATSSGACHGHYSGQIIRNLVRSSVERAVKWSNRYATAGRRQAMHPRGERRKERNR